MILALIKFFGLRYRLLYNGNTYYLLLRRTWLSPWRRPDTIAGYLTATQWMVYPNAFDSIKGAEAALKAHLGRNQYATTPVEIMAWDKHGKVI